MQVKNYFSRVYAQAVNLLMTIFGKQEIPSIGGSPSTSQKADTTYLPYAYFISYRAFFGGGTHGDSHMTITRDVPLTVENFSEFYEWLKQDRADGANVVINSITRL